MGYAARQDFAGSKNLCGCGGTPRTPALSLPKGLSELRGFCSNSFLLRLFRAGMRPGMDFAQLHDADVGVDLGGVEPGMAEHLLDEPDVGPVLQHVGRA